MTQARFTCLILCTLLVCTVFTLFQFISACARHDAEICQPAEDFRLFYTAGIHAKSNDTTSIYDVPAAQAILNMPAGLKVSFHPLLYPPQSLLLLSGLGFFDYNPALAAWFGIPLLMLFTCLRSEYIKIHAPDCPVNILIFLPFLLLAFLSGQNTVFWLALMLMVLIWRKTKPIYAGLALSLFSIKPQLGIFLPLLLLYEKNWRTLFVAILTTVALIALSILLWGTGIWVSYLQLLQVFSQIEKATPQDYLFPSASPFMAFRMLGVDTHIALALQCILSITVLVITWKNSRKCTSDAQILLLIATATLLFSSYSYIYDDILLALPCILLFERMKQGLAQAPERIAFILMAFIPIVAIKLHHMHIPYSFIAILFSFITTLHLLYRADHAVLPA